jgi:hypothetical protein
MQAAILHNLRLRFTDNLIYTHISSILVSINPFKQLPIYGPSLMKEYRDKLSRMERVAPHVYALADAAFTNMRTEERDQSVIISGGQETHTHALMAGNLILRVCMRSRSNPCSLWLVDWRDVCGGRMIQNPEQVRQYEHSKTPAREFSCGSILLTRIACCSFFVPSFFLLAGKTEATKLVLQYCAECSGQGNDVEQQLLSSNPIVEAFGNVSARAHAPVRQRRLTCWWLHLRAMLNRRTYVLCCACLFVAFAVCCSGQDRSQQQFFPFRQVG